MSFFVKNSSHLNLIRKEKPDDKGLRECQIGAYWATLGHFTASKEPALIVMPTGSGKTAVLMLLAFGLRAKRILIITPSVVLRDQIWKKFKTLDELVKQNVIPDTVGEVAVCRQKKCITTSKGWKNLEQYDVVVTTPRTISSICNKAVKPPPPDLFDIVFFDEAHHIAAPSWEELRKVFCKSKCIQLTATPFRLDKQKMPDEVVYRYPISRAIDNGIYQPVKYLKINASNIEESNQRLSDLAKSLLENERKAGRRTKILIRTDRVNKCKPLIKLYNKKGVNLEEVNYTKTIESNKKSLEKLEKDQLDGIVCVGMLGEGIDVPELKIAVLHSPPKSFPFTVQFIGRLSRPVDGKLGDAYVLADPGQIKVIEEDLRSLYYTEYDDWHRLIPDMVDDIVGKVKEEQSTPYPRFIEAIDPNDITPFYSVRAYQIQPNNLKLDTKVILGKDIIIYSLPSIDPNLRGLVTKRITTPNWAPNIPILETTSFDLHIYYYHEKAKILFESTTSDLLSSKIRNNIMQGANRLKVNELIKIMKSERHLSYSIVGLANSLGQCSSIPSYKTFLGTGIEGAVVPTDGRIFHIGHVLAKISPKESRGFAARQGRIWSTKRDSLDNFVEWCNKIGDLLVQNDITCLQEFPFFKNPKRVEHFPNVPIIEVIFDPLHMNYNLELVKDELQEKKSPPIEIESPKFSVQKVSTDLRYLYLDFLPNMDASTHINLQYDLEQDQWVNLDTTKYNCHFKSIDESNAEETASLELILSVHFSPRIYLRNGSSICDGLLYEPNLFYSKVPDECFEKGIDWSNCDIKREFDKKTDKNLNKPSVHNWLEQRLCKKISQNGIILKDHAAGELADFVVVDPLLGRETISFYHCKSSKKIGASLGHLKDVIDQVLRTVTLIKNPGLINEIENRGQGKSAAGRKRSNSKFVNGEEDKILERIEKIEKIFSPTKWNYEVVIVQPGLDSKKAAENENTKMVLLTCYEWLKAIGAQLKIMGYYPADD